MKRYCHCYLALYAKFEFSMQMRRTWPVVMIRAKLCSRNFQGKRLYFLYLSIGPSKILSLIGMSKFPSFFFSIFWGFSFLLSSSPLIVETVPRRYFAKLLAPARGVMLSEGSRVCLLLATVSVAILNN